eukprot:m.118401 g.118401  ORF g.118401 m.118401 type:complete len:989 (+) comp14511_c0_seq1:148-3114(+)
MVKIFPLPQFSRCDLLRTNIDTCPTAVCCTATHVVVGYPRALVTFTLDQECVGMLMLEYTIAGIHFLEQLNLLVTVEEAEGRFQVVLYEKWTAGSIDAPHRIRVVETGGTLLRQTFPTSTDPLGVILFKSLDRPIAVAVCNTTNSLLVSTGTRMTLIQVTRDTRAVVCTQLFTLTTLFVPTHLAIHDTVIAYSSAKRTCVLRLDPVSAAPHALEGATDVVEDEDCAIIPLTMQAQPANCLTLPLQSGAAAPLCVSGPFRIANHSLSGQEAAVTCLLDHQFGGDHTTVGVTLLRASQPGLPTSIKCLIACQSKAVLFSLTPTVRLLSNFVFMSNAVVHVAVTDTLLYAATPGFPGTIDAYSLGNVCVDVIDDSSQPVREPIVIGSERIAYPTRLGTNGRVLAVLAQMENSGNVYLLHLTDLPGLYQQIRDDCQTYKKQRPFYYQLMLEAQLLLRCKLSALATTALTLPALVEQHKTLQTLFTDSCFLLASHLKEEASIDIDRVASLFLRSGQTIETVLTELQLTPAVLTIAGPRTHAYGLLAAMFLKRLLLDPKSDDLTFTAETADLIVRIFAFFSPQDLPLIILKSPLDGYSSHLASELLQTLPQPNELHSAEFVQGILDVYESRPLPDAVIHDSAPKLIQLCVDHPSWLFCGHVAGALFPTLTGPVSSPAMQQTPLLVEMRTRAPAMLREILERLADRVTVSTAIVVFLWGTTMRDVSDVIALQLAFYLLFRAKHQPSQPDADAQAAAAHNLGVLLLSRLVRPHTPDEWCTLPLLPQRHGFLDSMSPFIPFRHTLRSQQRLVVALQSLLCSFYGRGIAHRILAEVQSVTQDFPGKHSIEILCIVDCGLFLDAVRAVVAHQPAVLAPFAATYIDPHSHLQWCELLDFLLQDSTPRHTPDPDPSTPVPADAAARAEGRAGRPDASGNTVKSVLAYLAAYVDLVELLEVIPPSLAVNPCLITIMEGCHRNALATAMCEDIRRDAADAAQP